MGALQLFFVVASLAAVSFGGGQVLLAGLERELVHGGVISPADYAAAVALGQATPGPIAAFTTAIGMSAAGLLGAVAATLAMVAVGMVAVIIASRVPAHWFRIPPVKAGLTAITAFAVSIAFFLAFRIGLAGDLSRWAGPVLIMGLVVAGRLIKLPTVALMAGSVVLGMLLQGTSLAGW